MNMLIPPLPSSPPGDMALTCLPLWQRLLFFTAIPNAIVYACMYFGYRYLAPLIFCLAPFTFSRSSPGNGGGVLQIIAAVVWLAIALVLLALPIELCTLLAAFRPWQRWYTALAGGFAGVGVGLVIGGVVMLIVKLATI